MQAPDGADYVARSRKVLAELGNAYNPEPTSMGALLTRELVLNSYWSALENKSQIEKDAALERVVYVAITPLYNVLRYHYAAAAFTGANLNRPRLPLGTILMKAAVHQDYDLCQILLDHGADPNFHGSFDSTPLFNIYTTSLAVLFVQKGANINARDIQLNSYLHMVSGFRYCEPLLVKFCVKCGLSPLDENRLGMNSLHMLVSSLWNSTLAGVQEKVEYLFEAFDNPGEIRALINTPDHGGNTIFGILEKYKCGHIKNYEWLSKNLQDRLDGTEKKKLA